MNNLLAGLHYSILDPTGNITALVESDVEIPRQPLVAAELMRRHPEVEQVGFVRLGEMQPGRRAADLWKMTQPEGQAADGREAVQVYLRMAGGEFCGNASMSAAALYLLRRQTAETKPQENPGGDMKGTGAEAEDAEEERTWMKGDTERVLLGVSGAAGPVEVLLERRSEDSFRTGIRMPYARKISRKRFSFDGLQGTLPAVRMEGISHIIIEEDSEFFRLLENRKAAGLAVRAWCRALDAEGLGLMFLEKEESAGPGFMDPECAGIRMRCTPLVYIPVSGTEFWENSCASGSAAAGMYLAAERGRAVSVRLTEPGGSLFIESDPEKKETWLYGKTRLIYSEPGRT